MFNLFRQLLPVIKGGNRAEVVSSCFKASMLWSSFERLSLTINVRLMNAPLTAKAMKYDSWLCLVGNGVTQNDNTAELSFQNVYQKQFENLRCIGSLEACARFFSIPQSEKFPSVQALTIHLPLEQLVTFAEGDEQRIASNSEMHKTELTDFFLVQSSPSKCEYKIL